MTDLRVPVYGTSGPRLILLHGGPGASGHMASVAGELRDAFRAIDSPVLMLHGAFDPHPGSMIRDGLLPFLPHLEYVEWERCGHYPWRERAVRDEFYRVVREWLAKRCEEER